MAGAEECITGSSDQGWTREIFFVLVCRLSITGQPWNNKSVQKTMHIMHEALHMIASVKPALMLEASFSSETSVEALEVAPDDFGRKLRLGFRNSFLTLFCCSLTLFC
jgi:hypothetical protein